MRPTRLISVPRPIPRHLHSGRDIYVREQTDCVAPWLHGESYVSRVKQAITLIDYMSRMIATRKNHTLHVVADSWEPQGGKLSAL